VVDVRLNNIAEVAELVNATIVENSERYGRQPLVFDHKDYIRNSRAGSNPALSNKEKEAKRRMEWQNTS
jgi:hypothetical protein